jgi:xylulokinase
LEEHSPEAARHTAHYLQAWDYIAVRLCGVPFTSSTWDDAAIAAAGLAADRFPPYSACGTVAGAVSEDAAARTGLPAGLPVIAGTNDSIMGLIGCGATARGRGSALGGTSGGFAVAWDETPGAWRPPPGTYPEPPGLQYFGAATAATGRILDWCLAATAGPLPDKGERDWEAEAALVPPGCAGLILLPYLAGERAPFRDPAARGLYFGLSLHHGAAHLVRAALEGVAYAVRHVMESTIERGAQVYDVRVFGGQARSALWNRIKADVTNRPVLVPAITEAGALGAAIVAAAGSGASPSIWEGAERMVRIVSRIDPDPRAAEVYDAAFAIYRELYPRLRDLFPALQRIAPPAAM